jgi:hypothetical protein
VYHALIAAKAKWDRGYEDLQTLKADTDRFAKREPYKIPVKLDGKSGWHIARLQVVEEPPPDLSVLVGAIAYQCLSALNLIAWELAARKIGRRKIFAPEIRRDISFPIAQCSKDFRSLRLVTQGYVSKQAVTAFDSVQPYSTRYGPGGPTHHDLFLIKELADSDKHRILSGALGRLDLGGISLKWNESVARDPEFVRNIKESWRSRYIEDGAELARVRFKVGNAKAKVSVDRHPPAHVAFRSDNWTVILDDVESCIATTMWTVRQFVPLFPGAGDPWA